MVLHRRRYDRPERFHEALAEAILARADVEPSAPSWNRGGWRGDGILAWGSPAIDQIADDVEDTLQAITRTPLVVAKAWTIVNRNGSYHTPHLHDAEWSAVYYVTDGVGATIFETVDGPIAIAPEAGLLVLFPSGIWHRTEPALGPSPRITIAFDAR